MLGAGVNMASATRKMFTAITRVSSCPGSSALWSLRPCRVRTLSLTSHCCGKSQRSTNGGENDELSKPIKFSTSQASHRTWKVDSSMGSTKQRPWWHVLPLSVFAISFLLWCFLRKESEVDKALEKQLYEHLPGLLTTEEEDEQTEAPKKEP